MPEIFSNQDWYLKAEGEEQTFCGTLRKMEPRSLSIGRGTLYFLDMDNRKYPIYTGMKDDPLLESLLNKSVKIKGKLVTMTVDRTRKEIWPASVNSSAEPCQQETS